MTIEATILTLKEFVMHMLRILPIILTVFSLFVGVGVANLSYFFLAIGLVLVVPIVRAITNPVLGALFDAFPGIKAHPEWFKVAPGADCSVLGGGAETVPTPMIPSYWWASVVFFGMYVLMNAVDMVSIESPANAPADKVQARKAHAGMAVVIILVFTLSLLVFRYTSMGGCETILGAIIGTILYGGLGYLWFTLLKGCTNSNMADLFGIASRIMPQRDAQERGSICYPIV